MKQSLLTKRKLLINSEFGTNKRVKRINDTSPESNANNNTPNSKIYKDGKTLQSDAPSSPKKKNMLRDQKAKSYKEESIGSTEGNKSVSNAIDWNDELSHYNECIICENGGKLICCDKCPRSYHISCIKPTPIIRKTETWLCPACTQSSKGICMICEECISASDEFIVKCPLCGGVVHMECLSIPLNLILDTPRYKGKSIDSIKAENDKLKRNTISLICLDCIKGRKVDYIIDFYNKTCKLPSESPSNNYYLIKLMKTSLFNTTWLSNQNLELLAKMKLKFFTSKYEIDEDYSEDYFHGITSEELDVEKVISKSIKVIDSSTVLIYYLIKWKYVPYVQSTWESEELISVIAPKEITKYETIATLEKSYSSSAVFHSEQQFAYQTLKSSQFVKFQEQPSFITEGTLRPYQLEGLNWLCSKWHSRCNVLLSDEMGLGKTIQSICFLRYLHHHNIVGPFLIIAPLSTLENWHREIEIWFPMANIVIYGDDVESRKFAISKDMFYRFKSEKNHDVDMSRIGCKFNILLTSPSIVNSSSCCGVFTSIEWNSVIIDESHRLKNKDCKLAQRIDGLTTKFIILMTGTPLQNNLQELQNLISIIAPNSISQLKSLVNQISTLNTINNKQKEMKDEEQIVKQIQEKLKPYILRRVKKDVLSDLPLKKELIIPVDMTEQQRKIYKLIFTRNFRILKELDKSSKVKTTLANTSNILMALRLCANHPLLLSQQHRKYMGITEDYIDANEKYTTDYDTLIKLSSKMLLLERLIKQLLPLHKILIFSQFKIMLDVLERFIKSINQQFYRLDGSTPHFERQKLIDAFNDPHSKVNIFILSTRAGGLGINLASADTVIMYDSDFNPHNDEQALSRAHRIGQKNRVLVLRFMTRYTVEEQILNVGKQKIALGKLILHPTKESKSIFDQILKFGAEKIFGEQEQKDIISYSEKQLSDFLSRDDEGWKRETSEENDLMNAFKVASYDIEERKNDEFWEKLLEKEALIEEKKQWDMFGKGKRHRKKIFNVTREKESGTSKNKEESDDNEDDNESSSYGSSVSSYEKKKSALDSTSQKSFIGIIYKEVAQLVEGDCHLIQLDIIQHNLAVKNEVDIALNIFDMILEVPMPIATRAHLITWGFNEINRYDFIQIITKFGIESKNWALLYESSKKVGILNSLQNKTEQQFTYYAYNFSEVIHRLYAQNKTLIPNFLTVGIPVIYIIERIFKISVIHALYNKFSALEKEYPKLELKNTSWNHASDYSLLASIIENGFGSWEIILKDKKNWKMIGNATHSEIYKAWMNFVCPNEKCSHIDSSHNAYATN